VRLWRGWRRRQQGSSSFLKKSTKKTFAGLPQRLEERPNLAIKSFLVLFFKKERLSAFPSR
jgi:hypothetical protein